MSRPFVYVPALDSHPTPYGLPYQAVQRSPFIPTIPIQGSPWTPVSSLPGSPNRPSAPLPAADGYIPAFLPIHPRRPSWNGAPPSSPILAPTQQQPLLRPRSNSHGASPYPIYQNPNPPLWPGAHPWFHPSNQIYVIHPWLNGEIPRTDFLFNLSHPNFSPMKLMGPGQQVLLSWEELSQPATHPPMTRLEIVCDGMPEWPIVLDVAQAAATAVAAGAAVPPIRLYDVLLIIHRTLHLQVTQDDWNRLPEEAQRRIGKAYDRRCALMPQLELVQKSQGVKRVDYLRKKVWFRGLVRMPQGVHTMKMIVA